MKFFQGDGHVWRPDELPCVNIEDVPWGCWAIERVDRASRFVGYTTEVGYGYARVCGNSLSRYASILVVKAKACDLELKRWV